MESHLKCSNVGGDVMCITKKEILEWNKIIQQINSFNNESEVELYLEDQVEDVELFITTLKGINKNKLKKEKKKKKIFKEEYNYTEQVIIQIFEENNLEDIVSEYTKKELIDMYLTLYTSKPLSSDDKTRIAQNIYQYIHTMNRTKALLG